MKEYKLLAVKTQKAWTTDKVIQVNFSVKKDKVRRNFKVFLRDTFSDCIGRAGHFDAGLVQVIDAAERKGLTMLNSGGGNRYCCFHVYHKFNTLPTKDCRFTGPKLNVAEFTESFKEQIQNLLDTETVSDEFANLFGE